MLDNDDERYNSSNDVPIPENQVTFLIDDIQHQNTQSVVFLLCSGITKRIESTFCHFWKSGVQWPIFFDIVSRFHQASTEPSCQKFVIITSKSSESVIQEVVSEKPNHNDNDTIEAFTQHQRDCVGFMPMASHVVFENFADSLDGGIIVDDGSAHIFSFLINFFTDGLHVSLFAVIPNEFWKIEQHGTQTKHKWNPLVILVMNLFMEPLVVLPDTWMNIPYL